MFHLIINDFIDSRSCYQLNLFNYSFDANSSLFGITSDYVNFFKIVQIGGTDTKNSWFYGNYVIEGMRREILLLCFTLH